MQKDADSSKRPFVVAYLSLFESCTACPVTGVGFAVAQGIDFQGIGMTVIAVPETASILCI